MLLSFSTAAAWELGSTLRALALKEYPDQSACIAITHANNVPLFVAHTGDGASPAYVAEIEAIKNSVRKWEIASWRRQRLLILGERPENGESAATTKSAEYSLKGGGWPIRVRGVLGVVAYVVVVGLYPVGGKPQNFNPLKYGPPTDVNHELVVKALEVVLDKQ